MPPFSSTRRAAFTLIELLTVIAIIGILAAIVIPTLGSVRNRAVTTRESNQVRTIITASLGYASDNKGILPNANLKIAGTDTGQGDRWTFGEAIERYLPNNNSNQGSIYNWKNNPVWYSSVTEAPSGWAYNASYPVATRPPAFGYNYRVDQPTWNGYLNRVPNPARTVYIGEILSESLKIEGDRAPVYTNNVNDSRYRISRDGKALYGFVDGHVEMLQGNQNESALAAAGRPNLWRWW